jgi:tRNA(Arg) A34 adenosine deaminase TadA
MFSEGDDQQYRRVATRYDTLAANYQAFIKLASIRIGYALMSPHPGLPVPPALCMMDGAAGAAMNSLSNLNASELDEHFLRRSFDVARRAVSHGNHPFGAILVDGSQNVLLEAENGYMPSRDGTAHAERLLATQACTTLSPEVLKGATLYSSAEPCAMCAGAIYWAGIGRLVYGLSEHRLRGVTGNHPENPTLDLPCREVFESGQRPTEVVGPLIEDEAEALHEGVWKK